MGENFINGEIAYSMVLRMLLLRAGVHPNPGPDDDDPAEDSLARRAVPTMSITDPLVCFLFLVCVLLLAPCTLPHYRRLFTFFA